MRSPLFITAMLAGVVCMGVVPAKATPQPMPGIAATKAQLAPVEDVGWRRRYRYGYPVPYAYYPLHMATITLRLRIGTTHLYIRHTRTMRPTHIGTTGLTMLPIERRWAGAGQG
jgi:hypothetical protein